MRLDGRVKLRHLTMFAEVAHARSVARAGERLNVSQPAVSKSIQELEAVLGANLFDRSRRSLALTAFGEAFLRYADASLSALRQGLSLAERSAAEVVVSVGALPTVSARVLPGAAAHFTAQGYGVRLRLTTGPNDFLLAQLRQGDLDLVIGRLGGAGSMAGLSFAPLYSERLAAVVRPGHPLLAASPFDMAALGACQAMLPPVGAAIRPAVDAFLVAKGIGPFREVIETVSLAFGRAYVRRSDAVWVISSGVVAEDLAGGLLAALPLDMTDTSGPVGLTTRADAMLSLPAQLFVGSVRAALRDDSPPA